MTCGIYLLEFAGTDKVYIGQSKCIESRAVFHRYKLNKGISSKRLNEAFNLFGMPNIKTLYECSEEELVPIEKDTIEVYDSINNGFNTMSETFGGYFASGELHHNSKYSNKEIEEAFLFLVNSPILTFKEVSIITKVSYSVICDIAKGANHKWLSEIYPKEYIELLQLKNNRNSAKVIGKESLSIVSPEGVEYTVSNIRAFSKKHNLCQSHLGAVLNKKTLQHKGWKLPN